MPRSSWKVNRYPLPRLWSFPLSSLIVAQGLPTCITSAGDSSSVTTPEAYGGIQFLGNRKELRLWFGQVLGVIFLYQVLVVCARADDTTLPAIKSLSWEIPIASNPHKQCGKTE